MSIEITINEKIQKLQDLNRDMGEIGKKIGALQEQGKALYNAALEVKGAIEALAAVKAAQDAAVASSQTAKLTLPEGVKPIVPEAAKSTLEVVQ